MSWTTPSFLARKEFTSTSVLLPGNMGVLVIPFLSISLSVLFHSFAPFAPGQKRFIYNSFEAVLPDSDRRVIKFKEGEKVKLCISFQNDVPAEGWQVTFVGDMFTNATIICHAVEKLRDAYIYCMMKDGQYTEIILDKVSGT